MGLFRLRADSRSGHRAVILRQRVLGMTMGNSEIGESPVNSLNQAMYNHEIRRLIQMEF